MKTFHKHQPVNVTTASGTFPGVIARSHGPHGYMVTIPRRYTTQDFTTGKLRDVDTTRTAYFKTTNIQPREALPT
jgi:hypothetical protein